MLTFQLDALSTLALALLLLGLGAQLKKRSYWLRQLCVPAPVIGGFGFALLIWLLRDRQLLDLTLDTSLQTPLMVAFFTTVGLGGSLGLLRKGGKLLFIYLGACWGLALVQNVVGVSVASASRWRGARAMRGSSIRAPGAICQKRSWRVSASSPWRSKTGAPRFSAKTAQSTAAAVASAKCARRGLTGSGVGALICSSSPRSAHNDSNSA